MKPAVDRAPNTKATRALRRDARRPRAAVLVGALGAALLALLPNAAQASHGFGGTRVGTAQISVTPDGYDNTGSISALFTQQAEVKGRNFGGAVPVEIFQCPAGVAPIHILFRCQPLMTALTQLDGTFAANVVYSTMFVSEEKLLTVPDPGRPVNYCRGFADFHVQCSIVAATFIFDARPTVLAPVPVAMAEHLICYEGGVTNNCEPRPT